MVLVALPLGCAAPSSSACEGDACDEGSGSADDGSSTGASAGTTAGATTAAMTTTDADESTGAPATTTGDDAPSDSTGEPPAECPAETHLCLAVPPADWGGPFVRRIAAGDAMPPDCAGAYETDMGVQVVDPESPPQSCDCACGNPIGVSCPVSIVHSAENDCGFPSVSNALTNNNCVNITDTGNDYWRINTTVSGGQCSAQSSFEIPEVEYGASVRFCATDAVPGCAETEVCLPIPTAPIPDTWCIFREGEHECPAEGPYTEGEVRFRGYDDSRGCSACSCEDPEGTCTGFTATLFTDDTCGIGTFGGSVDATCSLDTTASAPTVRAVRRSGAADIDADCSPSGGSATGELTLEDPITICCTE